MTIYNINLTDTECVQNGLKPKSTKWPHWFPSKSTWKAFQVCIIEIEYKKSKILFLSDLLFL